MPRALRLAFLLLLAAALPACAEFENQYNLAQAAPVQAASPLLGAYKGQWTSRTGHPRYLFPILSSEARLVIDRVPGSDAQEVWVALSNFWGIGNTAYFPPANLKISENTGHGTQFSAKIAAGLALVFVVDGRLEGDTISLRYKIVDVADQEIQHEQGTMTLHRVTKSP